MPGLTRRRRVSDAEDQDQDQDNIDSGHESESMQNGDSVDEMAKKLVRLALACECQRRPLRRSEINDKIMPARQFKRIYQQAQTELRTVFGMELVELPFKEPTTSTQRRAASQKQDSQRGTQMMSWAVSSILPSSFHQPGIISPAADGRANEDQTFTAIYTMIVACIALNGGTLPDAKMERYLRRLGMEDSTPVSGYEKIDKLVQRLIAHGYIVRTKETIGVGGEEEITWSLGPRGKVEVGAPGVRGMVEAIYATGPSESESELSRRIERSLTSGEKPISATQQRMTQRRNDMGTTIGADVDDQDP